MVVWMIDVDEEELQAAKEIAIEKYPACKIVSRVVDVSDSQAMMNLAEEVGGKCHFLMNNAGVGMGGGTMTDMNTVRFTMGVNT
jgi:NADP-dependent 3-hydroxy acid dehydrogenase YdfG